MPTYSKANATVQGIIDRLIEDYYPDLVESGARVEALFAYADLDDDGEAKSPAVREFGMAAVIKIKVNGEPAKLLGEPDATITIDHREWEKLGAEPGGEEAQRAHIDGMLHSLQVRKKEGAILTDDHGRPKLKVAKPDWLISGFRAMAERHGKHSAEVRLARNLHDNYGNLLFNFADDQAGQAILPGVEPEPKPRRDKRGAAAVAATHR